MKYLKTSGIVVLLIYLSLNIEQFNYSYAQEKASTFPEVSSIQQLDYSISEHFKISNLGDYTALSSLESVMLFDMRSNELVQDAYWSGYFIDWSADSQYLAITSNLYPCKFPEVETTLVIVNLAETEKFTQCLPFQYSDLRITWSPLTSNLLLFNDLWIFDVSEISITSVGKKFDNRIDFFDFRRDFQLDGQNERYIGLDKYIWDVNGAPLAKLTYERVVADNSNIQQNQFKLCGLPGTFANPYNSCSTIIEIPSNLQVFYYGLSTQDVSKLLWVAHENDDNASSLFRLDNYLDTVIFMTAILTDETQEIFRLSSLESEQIFVRNGVDWSSDGTTIALTYARFEGEMPRRAIRDSEKSIMITLDWNE